MVFTATLNTSYKNARKKPNTRHYSLKIKVSDVCWIGGGGWTLNGHESPTIKTHQFSRFLPIFGRFCMVFYMFLDRIQQSIFVPTSPRLYCFPVEKSSVLYLYRKSREVEYLLVVLPWLPDMIACFYHGCMDRFIRAEQFLQVDRYADFFIIHRN